MVQHYNYSRCVYLGLLLSLTLSSLCLCAHSSRLHMNENEEGYLLDLDSKEGGPKKTSVSKMDAKETDMLVNADDDTMDVKETDMLIDNDNTMDINEPDPDDMKSNTDELVSHITPAIHGATPSSASLMTQPLDTSSPSPSSSSVVASGSDDVNRLFSGLVGGGGGGSGYGSGNNGGYGYGSGGGGSGMPGQGNLPRNGGGGYGFGSGGDGASGYGRGGGYGSGNGGSGWGGGSGYGSGRGGGSGYGSGGGGGYGYGSGGGGGGNGNNGYGSDGGSGGPGIIDESPGSASAGSWLLMPNICKMFCN